jgi:hypothetical protein
LIPKIKYFSAVIFFNFWSLKPWIRIGIQPKKLDPDPDQDEMNADPQPCIQHILVGGYFLKTPTPPTDGITTKIM